MLLVVVLGIIAVLGLLGATFSFRMNADLAGVGALGHQQQARLAADSGMDRVMQILRTERTNVDAWFRNEEAFRRTPVYMPGEQGWIGGTEMLAYKERVENKPVWRFSVVAYEVDGDDTKIRYGVTDEASKINLNVASRAQLLALLDQYEIEDVSPVMLVDAIIDWRDEDTTEISLNGAESPYYLDLEPAYRAKDNDFDTVEELLMVKGWSGRILYGEDYNRNGYLDNNEDDGEDGVFPPDDGDGVLNRGLLPFLTTHSWDLDFSNENKPRIPLAAITSTEFLEDPNFEYLAELIRPEVVDFIIEVNKAGYKFRSVAELYELVLYDDGSSNYTDAWEEYDALLADANTDRLEIAEEQEAEDGALDSVDDLTPDDLEPEPAEEEGEAEGDRSDIDDADLDSSLEQEEDDKLERQRQAPRPERPDRPERPGRGDRDDEEAPGEGSGPPGADGAREERPPDEESGRDGRDGQDGEEEADEPPQPLDLENPIAAEDMMVLMDVFTAKESPFEPLVGRINVNTASPRVLNTIPALTEENVETIVSVREQLDGEDKASLAWLVVQGVLDAETFVLVSNQLTTRSLQYHVEVIGFADHVGAFKRIEAIVEMRGQVGQIRYYRDISSLGIGYPVWDDQLDEGFSYAD